MTQPYWLAFLRVSVAMRTRFGFFVLIFSLLLFLSSPAISAPDTEAIDAVRNKEVLSEGDFAVIETFVAEAVTDLVKVRDLPEIAVIRLEIEQRKSSLQQSSSKQYERQFYKSAYKHISEAFNRAMKVNQENRRFLVMTNLLVLVDQLDNLRITELVLRTLKSRNKVIQYLSVCCLADSRIIKELNKPANEKLASRITDKLQEIVDCNEYEIIGSIADFSAGVKTPGAKKLLVRVADDRIARYANFSVKNEISNCVLLKSLSRKMMSERSGSDEVGRRFAQLFSYVMQRYILDLEGKEQLSKLARPEIRSVLVEVEEKCIKRLLNSKQSLIKKALERSDSGMLTEEHNRLFGDGTRPGLIPQKYNFDYGQDGSGKRLLGPVSLNPRPNAQAKGGAGGLLVK
jgi:hypothetical protein